jgi:hypothetical protein
MMPRSPYRGVRVVSVMLYSLDRRLYARRVKPRYRRW